jgi:hypothetical protein
MVGAAGGLSAEVGPTSAKRAADTALKAFTRPQPNELP